MLLIIPIWLYMLLTSFITGYGFVTILSGAKKNNRIEFESYILFGIGFLTVYAQIFSLFYKVGLIANILLVIGSTMIFLYYRKEIIEYIKDLGGKNISSYIVFFILFILFAYGTSHGYMHYDSDLYHAQSIRWIEDYGVVKGLGNLHSRLGYNSAAFSLSALFSMRFLLGQSYHACAGFLALIIASMCRGLFKRGEFLSLNMLNIVRVVAIYYLAIIFDEMVSPASDYFVVLMIIAVVMLFVKEQKNDDPTMLGMICMLSLIVLSYKISGGILCLIAIYPICAFAKNRDIKSIVKFSLTGLCITLPLIIRNVILTGYLIYPMPGIDIFNFKHKVPYAIAEYDSKEIQVYGRGHIDITRFDEAFLIWMPKWFENLDPVNKLTFLMSLICIVLVLGTMIYVIIKRRTDIIKDMFIIYILAICYLGWIFTSPNIRFGCIFLWLFPIMTLGYFFMKFSIKYPKCNLLFSVLVLLFLIYKSFAFGKELIAERSFEYIFHQQEYGTYEVDTFCINGNTFYVPKEGDQTGYDSFPGAPFIPNSTMFSNDIKDGFYPLDETLN